MLTFYDPSKPEMLSIYVLSIDRYARVKSVLYNGTPEYGRTVRFFPNAPYQDLDLNRYELGVAHDLEHDHFLEYHGFVVGPATQTKELLAIAQQTLEQQRLVIIAKACDHIKSLTANPLLNW